MCHSWACACLCFPEQLWIVPTVKQTDRQRIVYPSVYCQFICCIVCLCICTSAVFGYFHALCVCCQWERCSTLFFCFSYLLRSGFGLKEDLELCRWLNRNKALFCFLTVLSGCRGCRVTSILARRFDSRYLDHPKSGFFFFVSWIDICPSPSCGFRSNDYDITHHHHHHHSLPICFFKLTCLKCIIILYVQS